MIEKRKGQLTLPSENGFLEETKTIMEKWGADALRDSDGTKLDDDLKNLDAKIYTTYFVSRGHNDFMKDHMDETQRLYLMSAHCLAVSNSLTIPIMKGYFSKQVTPDISSDPKKYWEVIDRTTEKVVPPEKWSYSEDGEEVTISETEPFHEYTVTFLARAIWDPTQMYNHITNDW